jgi:hypothetical protein
MPGCAARLHLPYHQWPAADQLLAGSGRSQRAGTSGGRPRSDARWSLARPGSTSTAPAATPAGRSICARSTATRWRPWAASCWACAARGTRAQGRCPRSPGCTPCPCPSGQPRRDDNEKQATSTVAGNKCDTPATPLSEGRLLTLRDRRVDEFGSGESSRFASVRIDRRLVDLAPERCQLLPKLRR